MGDVGDSPDPCPWMDRSHTDCYRKRIRKEKDPIDLQRKKLLKLRLPEEEIKKIEKEIDNKIEKSVDLAQKAPFAEISEAYKDVFYEKN